MKRIALFVAVFAFAGAAIAQQNSSIASGQAYPNRPVRMVIPWPPGQATDLVGRVLAQKLAELCLLYTSPSPRD